MFDDWMLVYFGCVFLTDPQVAGPGLLRVTGPTWDMHGYMIRDALWSDLHRVLGKVSRRRGVIDGKLQGACDVIMAEYHERYAAYAVWPPMAWQVKGLSNNENSVRGNYQEDGTQAYFRECIRDLPGVLSNDGENERRREGARVRRGREGIIVRSAAECVQPAAAVEGTACGAGVRSVVRGDIAREETGKQGCSASHGAGCDCLDSGSGLPQFTAAAPHGREQRCRDGRGFLLSPYSPVTERMAFGQARLLRKYNPDTHPA